MGGGFVYSDKAVTLAFPVRRNSQYNPGGGAAPQAQPEPDPESVMEVNFILRCGELTYSMAGLGMHPKAKKGRDLLDKISMPQNLQFLQLNFAHPEDPAGRFTKEMIPDQGEGRWEFTVEAPQPRDVTLEWKNHFNAPADKQLLLYDVSRGTVVDMRQADQYSFHLARSKSFKVYYGTREWLRDTLTREFRMERLLPGIPNPFDGQTMITFTLPERSTPYDVALSVFDRTGRKVADLVAGEYEAGFHEVVWHGTGPAGFRLPAGMYVARLVVDRRRHYSIKLIAR